jgi:hypothetical protein
MVTSALISVNLKIEYKPPVINSPGNRCARIPINPSIFDGPHGPKPPKAKQLAKTTSTPHPINIDFEITP